MHHGTVKKDYKLTKETIMLDTRGVEIEAGDTIVHASAGRHGKGIAVYIVDRLTEKRVRPVQETHKYYGQTFLDPNNCIVISEDLPNPL